MSYTSQQPYGGPVGMPEQRGPDIGSAGLPARQLAASLEQVGTQWAGFWAAAEQAKAVSAASAATAAASTELGDMVLGFEKDPDPAGVPGRFKERVAEWKAQKLEGLAPPVQRLVGQWIDRAGAAAYNQVNGSASRRLTQQFQAEAATANGTHAQRLADAMDPAAAAAEVQAMKANIAGYVASGVIPQGDQQAWFSRSMAQAITIRAARDPIGAQKLLEQHRAEMDAGTVAQLTTSLRAPVERREDEDFVQGRLSLADATRSRAQGIVQGLMDRDLPQHVAMGLAANAIQESGANPNPQPGDGGRSFHLMQWNADRLAALRAQFGDNPTLDQQLDFVVAELKGSEKRAGDALAATRTPEEAARVASTMYLRPANTAVEERRRAAYATLLSGGSARMTVMDEVRQASADLPLSRQMHREALVQQWFNQQEAQQGQERALLGQQLTDLRASYLQGETAAAVPEARIRQLYGPEIGQRHIDELTIARATGDAIKATAYASPAEQDAARARLIGDPADTRNAAERQQAVAHYDQAMARVRTALRDDPAGYALTAPEVRKLAGDGASMPQIAAASLAVQERMGVLPGNRRVLTGDQIARLTDTLRTTGPDKADMAVTLGNIAQQFGPELWSRAYGELVRHGKIGWEWQAVAAMTAPQQAEGRALLQRALVFTAERGGPEAVRKLVAPDVLKGFDTEVDTALEPLREATRHHPGGDSLFATMKQAVTTLALYHAWRGQKAGDAASRAYQDVIGARWDTAGDDGSGLFGRTPTMLVPKGKAGDIETALDLVRTRLQPGDLLPLSNPSNPQATPAELLQATHQAAQRGLWVNNADASGAVLKGRTPGGSVVNILRADGSPIEVRFDALPRLDPAARNQLELIDGRAAARDQLQRMRQPRPQQGQP